MCDMDCFNCSKPDCDNDELTRDERISQDVRDRFARYERKTGAERKRIEQKKKYDASEKGKLRTQRYNNSAKGKAARQRYNQSEKGKERSRQYYLRIKSTEAGREAIRQRNQKVIASGKNAEYCRAYYQRKKEKMFRELMMG